MTDTTNTPDESDGQGSVSTGEPIRDVVTPTSGIPVAGGDGAASGEDADGSRSAGGDGGSVTGRPRPSPYPNRRGNGNGSTSASGSAEPNGSTGAADAEASTDPTVPGMPAEVPLMAAPDRVVATPQAGPSEIVPAPELEALRPPGVDDSLVAFVAERPSPSPPTAASTLDLALDGVDAAPTPAPGPVPGPGPGAAAAPPWRRMPGSEPVAAQPTGPVDTGSAGGLLDDVPTVFVEPAGPAGGPPPRRSWAEPSERTGWAPAMRTRVRPPRRAALQLKRLDPWSVLKLALVLSGVLFLIWLVAVGLLYGVLDGMGVWDRLNGTYSDLVSGEGGGGGEALISAWRVLGTAALFGLVNSVLFAASLTVGAFVYNVSADLVGGIEVTLSERD